MRGPAARAGTLRVPYIDGALQQALRLEMVARGDGSALDGDSDGPGAHRDDDEVR